MCCNCLCLVGLHKYVTCNTTTTCGFRVQSLHDSTLKGLAIDARGKAQAKLYKALSAADRKTLNTAAAKHPGFKRHRVQASVRKQIRAAGVPVSKAKNLWFNAKGNGTKAKIQNIAAKLGVKLRKPRKVQ